MIGEGGAYTAAYEEAVGPEEGGYEPQPIAADVGVSGPAEYAAGWSGSAVRARRRPCGVACAEPSSGRCTVGRSGWTFAGAAAVGAAGGALGLSGGVLAGAEVSAAGAVVERGNAESGAEEARRCGVSSLWAASCWARSRSRSSRRVKGRSGTAGVVGSWGSIVA
ncbi:hypothetical protein SCMU_21870 [Sinomonas cyclohexanicum]|uniref:Uncharacterized protein n=1 Tax=Sinomonas cyclohexanicum TaxID=322009 RepID=A0ABN6FJ38_SINCY|nr:hypothetical protein SCMU_21870 [Corynebacterium cyclohexanicum]